MARATSFVRGGSCVFILDGVGDIVLGVVVVGRCGWHARARDVALQRLAQKCCPNTVILDVLRTVVVFLTITCFRDVAVCFRGLDVAVCFRGLDVAVRGV